MTSRELLHLAKRAVRLVTHNFLWKVASLAGAVIIWALVASEPELSTFTTVRLEFRNLPPHTEISSTPVESVTLELRGPADELRGQGEDRGPAVVLDMHDVVPGRRTFPIGGSNVNLPRGVRLVRSFPSEVRFEFEPRLTREVPVQVQFTKGQNLATIAGYTVSPDKLEIEGPAGHVQRIATVATDPVAAPAAPGETHVRVNAFVSDSYVRFRSSPQVEVTVTTRSPKGP
jgi:YbbR domain-containing protein